MNKLMYERDEYLAHLLGYKTKLIGTKTHILIKSKWEGFQTNNDLGKMKLLRLFHKRKDSDFFFSGCSVFDLISLLENKTGQFRDEVIKHLETKQGV